jgi:hypothetical protein
MNGSVQMLVACGLALLSLGCDTAAKSPTIGGLVTAIVARAKANDERFFSRYLDESFKGQEARLIAMINASGMATNFNARTTVNGDHATMDYHDLSAGCHFQIELEKRGSDWTIKRIFFCR